MQNKYDQNLPPLLKPSESLSQHTRGHNLKLYHQSARTNLRKFSFTQRIVKLWNRLPWEVVNSPSTHCFERRLDKAWNNMTAKFNHLEDPSEWKIPEPGSISQITDELSGEAEACAQKRNL